MPMPRKLTDEKVVRLREMYKNARAYSDGLDPADEGYETVVETEERIGGVFGISRSLVRRIVLGLSYADVGGHIDEKRRAGSREIAVPATSVRVIIDKPGASPATFVYPPGTRVIVEGSPENPDDYNASGRPKATTTSTSAASTGSTTTPQADVKKAAPDPAADAAKRKRDRIARLEERLANPMTADSRKPALERQLDKLRYRGDAPDSAASASGNI